MTTYHRLTPSDYPLATLCDDCLAVVIGAAAHTAWHEHMALPPVNPTPVGPHYTTEITDAGGWGISEPVVSRLSDDVQKALAQLRAGNTFTFHDDACTHTPTLPSRADAVEELARVYENTSTESYPDYYGVRRGIGAIYDRVFAYLKDGK